MSFEERIKEWVSTDNMMKLYLEKVRELRHKRNDITDALVTYAADQNLEHAVIQISDGRLKFQQTKTTAPLTFKFIEHCLHECIVNTEDSECITNQDDVTQIIKYIKEKRATRIVPDIKRFYTK